MEIDQWRREYVSGGLSRADLCDTPLEQFDKWLQELAPAGLSDPSSMILATADANGRPSQRVVLLKGYGDKGFTFFTNLQSQKARDIAANPQVCLLFPWHALDRQVIIYGRAEELDRQEAQAYFQTRPRDSQLAAWASHQSEPVESREQLEKAFLQTRERFPDEVPLPDFWGGYRVVPDTVEFWQGRASRLHDRFMYLLQDDGSWKVERLSP
ncbi:pyridoxamine 5'-phosphate oxidase [Microbulbifer yueqingensis]|uniref:Pyridoxine/pyridoxamine 5'-phosphate oxidase n=1 Tax=Microbulbifer yueqingensis TaxID=658219 RepID=A0A1G8V141_9GAMM|nr:pyridoxamine 5'-phosphate oxidase [Microbulbifer yueqingensis]SDJ59065.1 Pyridoxamine 5'-phosphate oxidase [Microbulbifer yueqingensis]